MSNTYVPRVELNKDGTITLYVNVPDFDEGTPIEISGQATQTNGAAATFYSVQVMPGHGTQDAPLAVRSVPAVPPNQFAAGFPITVVVRAAEVSITALEPQAPDPDEGAQPAQGDPGEINAAWNEDYHQSAVVPTVFLY